ncbi:MAG TPA: sugar-binding protein [Candidatus Limnocylindrales bacterium]|nr:sugar-binding protein [Candidatus Limnocylindrales bacterium]
MLVVVAAVVVVALVLVRSMTPTPAPTARHGLVNPAHLDFLTEPIEVAARPMAIVHIYSEAPAYRWVDASGEGISAVDDIARAVLVYLELGSRQDGGPALERARLLLETVMYLQTTDGQYHNFLRDRTGTINTDGPTSYADWGWWAARGQRALAQGYASFRTADPAFAARLRAAYEKGEAALERTLTESAATESSLHGVRQPAGLLKGGTDVSSLALVGLAEWYQVEPNDRTRRLAFRIGQAVAESRAGDGLTYPFGLRPSTTSSTAFWHAWGGHSVEALARAGQTFERDDWITTARAEAETWYGRLMTAGMIREIGVLPRRYDQIAYGQTPIVLGFAALAEATGDDRYRRLAGLAAAWFFGDNPARTAMYDPATGRGFDGVTGGSELRVNRNAGAESTIEALLALQAVADDPVASPLLTARTVEPANGGLIVEAERGRTAGGDPRYGLQDWTGEAFYSGGRFEALGEGDSLALPVTIAAPGAYDLYLAHLRQAGTARRLDVEAVRAPVAPTIDGDAADWPEAQPIAVDSAQQILRGASSWPGPDRAAMELRLAWDARHLYVLVDVRDPEHSQAGVGPDVWRGDAVWLYLDTTGQRSRVDKKLTLAQTPSGPQVWDWVGQGFLPEATLAWRESPRGYRYEAALPWASLNRQAADAGARMGFEAGLGFAGGFIDWTGTDPDTPSNLAPLTLVETLAEAPPRVARDPRPEAIALRVELDGRPLATIPERVSPDRDYLWLDRIAGPLDLASGDHEILLSFAGLDPAGESVVDGLWLIPRPLERAWLLEDGSQVGLRFDPSSGLLAWSE